MKIFMDLIQLFLKYTNKVLNEKQHRGWGGGMMTNGER